MAFDRPANQRNPSGNPDEQSVVADLEQHKARKHHPQHKTPAAEIGRVFQIPNAHHFAEHQQHGVTVRHILEHDRDIVAVYRAQRAHRQRKRPQPDRRAEPAHEHLTVTDNRRPKDGLSQNIEEHAKIAAAQQPPRADAQLDQRRAERRMIRVPRLPAQRLPKLRRGIRVHCDRIADRQMRQPAQQNNGRAEQHRMRPIRAQQRAVFCRAHIQPSIQPGFQQAEKQLKQARHAQRQDDCFKRLTVGQKRLIQAVRVAHADRNHLPRAHHQRRQLHAAA